MPERDIEKTKNMFLIENYNVTISVRYLSKITTGIKRHMKVWVQEKSGF